MAHAQGLNHSNLTNAAAYAQELTASRKVTCQQRMDEARNHPDDKVRETRWREITIIRKGGKVLDRTAKEIIGE
jgi:hypothetical protein